MLTNQQTPDVNYPKVFYILYDFYSNMPNKWTLKIHNGIIYHQNY